MHESRGTPRPDRDIDCRRARTLYSAALDGESEPGDQPRLDRHLATCAACRTFAAEAGALHRVVRIAPADEVPDLTAAILRATAASTAAAPAVAATPPIALVSGWSRPLRLALFTIALVEILIALPSLLGGSEHVQHLAAFDVALAVGFLWVAAQPARALSGFLPIGTALVVLCVGLALVDATRGYGESVRVVTHSIAVLGMIVAWLLEAQAHRPATSAHLAS